MKRNKTNHREQRAGTSPYMRHGKKEHDYSGMYRSLPESSALRGWRSGRGRTDDLAGTAR